MEVCKKTPSLNKPVGEPPNKPHDWPPFILKNNRQSDDFENRDFNFDFLHGRLKRLQQQQEYKQRADINADNNANTINSITTNVPIDTQIDGELLPVRLSNKESTQTAMVDTDTVVTIDINTDTCIDTDNNTNNDTAIDTTDNGNDAVNDDDAGINSASPENNTVFDPVFDYLLSNVAQKAMSTSIHRFRYPQLKKSILDQDDPIRKFLEHNNITSYRAFLNSKSNHYSCMWYYLSLIHI